MLNFTYNLPVWQLKKCSYFFRDEEMKHSLSYSKSDDMLVDVIWSTTLVDVYIFRIHKKPYKHHTPHLPLPTKKKEKEKKNLQNTKKKTNQQQQTPTTTKQTNKETKSPNIYDTGFSLAK